MSLFANTCKEHDIDCVLANRNGACILPERFRECPISCAKPVESTEPPNLDPPEPTEDPVNSPSHYMHGGVETIDIIRSMLTPEEFRGYLKGNILKYRERAMFKGKTDEDYAKAKKYYDWLREDGNNE